MVVTENLATTTINCYPQLSFCGLSHRDPRSERRQLLTVMCFWMESACLVCMWAPRNTLLRQMCPSTLFISNIFKSPYNTSTNLSLRRPTGQGAEDSCSYISCCLITEERLYVCVLLTPRSVLAGEATPGKTTHASLVDGRGLT